MPDILFTGQLVDATILYVDNIPVDEAEPSKRLRYERLAQERVNDFTGLYEWLWMVGEEDVTPDANGRFSLPTRFKDVGRHGALVLKATGEPFVDAPLKELREERYSPLGAGRIMKFAIGLAEEPLAESFITPARYGWVPRGWAGQLLTLSFRKNSPQLLDDASVPELDTGLPEIPADYRNGLLVYALRASAYDDKGDNRAAKWEVRYEIALNHAIEAERPQKDEGLVMGGSGHADQC